MSRAFRAAFLRVPDGELRALHAEVSRVKRAGGRIGVDWTPTVTKIKEREDDSWIAREDLKPLDDVCTKFCTNKYFPNATVRVNMIANLCRIYDRLRDLAKLRADIIFKGGVMIRILLLMFAQTLPVLARTRYVEYMESHHALGMSDLDFEMVPENPDPNPEYVHRLFLLDYLVLLWVQRAMQHELEGKVSRPVLLTIDPTRGTAAELHDALQTCIDGLPSDHALHGARVDYVVLGGRVDRPLEGWVTKSGKAVPAPRRNVAVFTCGTTKCVAPASDVCRELGVRGAAVHSGGDLLYATMNTYIGEGTERARPQHRTGTFHLARIKHTFTLYYTTADGQRRCDRLGGEMIDLSQSHSDRANETRAKMHREVSTLYAEYPMWGVEGVKLRSYSIEGFLHDHRSMLHHQEQPPWKVQKREKRQLRYVGFLVAHVLSSSVTGRLEAKLDRLHEAVAQLRGSAPPRASGLRVVDAFVSRELDCPLTYRRPMAKHLSALVGCVIAGVEERRRPPRALDPTLLRSMNEHLFDYALDDVQTRVNRAALRAMPDLTLRLLSKFKEIEAWATKAGIQGLHLNPQQHNEWLILSALQHVTLQAREPLIDHLLDSGVITSPFKQKVNFWNKVFCALRGRAHHEVHFSKFAELFEVIESCIDIETLHSKLQKELGNYQFSIGQAVSANCLPQKKGYTWSGMKHPFLNLYSCGSDEYDAIRIYDVFIPITVKGELSKERTYYTNPLTLFRITVSNDFSLPSKTLTIAGTNLLIPVVTFKSISQSLLLLPKSSQVWSALASVYENETGKKDRIATDFQKSLSFDIPFLLSSIVD